MDIAAELLRLTIWLATLDQDCGQAALRRSVSTAYYAVFHLLTADAAARWAVTDAEHKLVKRAFNHGQMKAISSEWAKGNMGVFSGALDSPEHLRDLAKAFVDLQTARHSADYESDRAWSRTEVFEIMNRANRFFGIWQQVRTHPLANSYLLSMLIGKGRAAS